MLDLVTVILAAGKGRTEERSFELYQPGSALPLQVGAGAKGAGA